jgi:hypothetical protein
VLLPSHGPAISRVERTLRRYIDHRQAREEQIVRALEEQPRPVEALVALIYPTIHPQLQPAARDTIVAHLLKLQDERRAVETGGVWALLSPGSSR